MTKKRRLLLYEGTLLTSIGVWRRVSNLSSPHPTLMSLIADPNEPDRK